MMNGFSEFLNHGYLDRETFGIVFTLKLFKFVNLNNLYINTQPSDENFVTET